MGNLKPSRALKAGSVFAVVMLLAFAFNNCGKVSTYSTESSQLESYPVKVQKLTAQYSGKLGAEFCERSENYACVHKVFSASTQSASLGETPECVKLLQGGELCPNVQHHAYNSASATENCQKNCTESYEFEDYDCHLKLPTSLASGTYPLVVSRPRLADSLEALRESCLQIEKGSAR